MTSFGRTLPGGARQGDSETSNRGAQTLGPTVTAGQLDPSASMGGSWRLAGGWRSRGLSGGRERVRCRNGTTPGDDQAQGAAERRPAPEVPGGEKVNVRGSTEARVSQVDLFLLLQASFSKKMPLWRVLNDLKKRCILRLLQMLWETEQTALSVKVSEQTQLVCTEPVLRLLRTSLKSWFDDVWVCWLRGNAWQEKALARWRPAVPVTGRPPQLRASWLPLLLCWLQAQSLEGALRDGPQRAGPQETQLLHTGLTSSPCTIFREDNHFYCLNN